MLVNNEIGAIQPIAEVYAIARRRGALLFCDAVQGFGRFPVPPDACDMVALSSHKVNGPKGIGALWIRDGVADDPLQIGSAPWRDRVGTVACSAVWPVQEKKKQNEQ